MGKLLLDRDFSKFLENENFPHEVAVWFGDVKFVTCSGVILAQQSAVIEHIICENDGVLILENLESYEISDLKECLRFLYGADVSLNLRNIAPVMAFSSIYGVEDLFALAFIWMQRHINVENLSLFFEISLKLAERHTYPFLGVLNDFLADNVSDVVIEASKYLKNGKYLNTHFLCSILKHSLSSCSELIFDWISQTPDHAMFILNNLDTIDIFKHFPISDDFTKLISSLSTSATSVQTMEKLITLQQSYFTRGAKQPETETKDKSLRVLDSSCTLLRYYTSVARKISLRSCTDHRFMISVPSIPVYASVGDIKKAFVRFGNVEDVLLISIDSRNKLAFVSFEEQVSVENASACEVVISRKPVPVKPYVKVLDSHQPIGCEKRLFIKSIPMKTSIRDLEKTFSSFGKTKEIEIIRHKRCAFIEFADPRTVQIVFHFYANGVVLRVLGQKVTIERFKVSKT